MIPSLWKQYLLLLLPFLSKSIIHLLNLHLSTFLSLSVLLILWTLQQLIHFLLRLTFLLTLILLSRQLNTGYNLTIRHSLASDIIVGDDNK